MQTEWWDRNNKSNQNFKNNVVEALVSPTSDGDRQESGL